MKEFGEKSAEQNYVDRPGAYGLIIQNKKIMVIEIEGYFFLPGGGLDKGETHEQGLQREIREETGYDITITKFAGEAAQYMYSYRERKYFRKVGYFYQVDLLEKKQTPGEKNHVVRWEDNSVARKLLTHEFQSWAVAQYT